MRSVFHRLGYSPAVATILALLCTECPRRQVVYDGQTYFVASGPRGLPQGACTSPALSNQVARRLDKRLGGLARKLDLTYTRYADDLTFSGGATLSERVGYLMARVRHLAEDEGFAVNEKKSRVLRRNTAQLVTGLVVNDRPGVRRREVRPHPRDLASSPCGRVGSAEPRGPAPLHLLAAGQDRLHRNGPAGNGPAIGSGTELAAGKHAFTKFRLKRSPAFPKKAGFCVTAPSKNKDS